MTDFIRKALMAGVGATSAMLKIMDQELKRLVKLGKINIAEADKIFNSLVTAGEKEFKTSRKSLEEAVRNAVATIGVVRKSELEALKKRVSALEKKISARRKG